MKITAFDELYSQNLGTGNVYIGGSNGSNSSFAGGDVVGEPGDLSVVGLRRTVALSSNLTGGIGDVLTIIATNPRTAQFATPSNSGNFELKNEGGQSTIFAHGSMGSTETFDPTDGNVHTGTLNANCTFTLSAPTGSGAALLELWLTEDGTGGWTVTWPGSVTEQGSHDTTLGTTSRVLVETIDGGTSWVATWIGSATISYATPAIVLGSSAAAGAATTVIRSDATIAAFDATVPVTQAFSDAAATGSAAFAARRDHVHGMPASPTSASGDHAHVVGETHLSDGSTTTYTLDEAFEPGSVEAWNTTSLAYLTVTETQPDQATVSAAGSSGDKITFSYAATLV